MKKVITLALILILTSIMYLPKPILAQNLNTYIGSLEKVAHASASYNEGAASFMNDGVIKYGQTDGRWHSWSGEQVILNPWVQYDFPMEIKSDTISIYWYNDNGGVKLPDDVSVSVWNSSEWKQLNITNSLRKGCHELIQFEESTFKKIRLSINNTTVNAAAGIVEWKVYPSNTNDPCAYALADSSFYFGANDPLYLNDNSITYELLDGRWSSYNGDDVLLNPWVSYDFIKPVISNMIKIYWYNDGGGVKLPDSVKVEVIKKDASDWSEVSVIREDKANNDEVIVFEPVEFTKIRLVINNNTVNAAAGIVEWDVYPYDSYEVDVYAKQSASHTNTNDFLIYLNDGVQSNKWTCYGNKENPWVQYDLNSETEISKTTINWYDDGGGVKQPDSFSVNYWNGNSWIPVNIIKEGNSSTRSTILFEPIKTNKIKIIADNTVSDAAIGITEWKVYKAGDKIYLQEYAESTASHTNPSDFITNLNDGCYSSRWTCYGNHKDIYIEYSFNDEITCNKSELVWYHDNSGVLYPDDINVYYLDGNDYKVINLISKETVNGITTVIFEPVTTKNIRITVDNTNSNAACGILEWVLTGCEKVDNPKTNDSDILLTLLLASIMLLSLRKRVSYYEK